MEKYKLENKFSSVSSLILLSIVFSLTIHFSNGVTSPCPKIFNYQFDGYKWYGQIVVPEFPAESIRLKITLSISTYLPSQYIGKIEAVVRQNYIIYYVHFPTNNPVPKLTSIQLNNVVICEGPRAYGHISTITLVNTLIPTVDRFGSQHNNFNHHNHNNNDLGFILVQPTDNENVQSTTVKPETQSQTSTNSNNGMSSISDKDILDVIANFANISGFQIEIDTSNSESSTSIPTNHPEHNIDSSTQPSITLEPTVPTKFSENIDPISDTDTNEVCGTSVTVNPLIAQGTHTVKGEYPWLTALFVEQPLGLEFRCAGSLVSHRHIVTAAHCIKYGQLPLVEPTNLIAVLGKHNIRKWTPESGSKILQAESFVLHPDFKADTLGFEADIAIIILTETVEYTNTIRPVCLWKSVRDLSKIEGHTGTVVGWGRDEKGNKVTNEPTQVQLPIVSQEECLRKNPQFINFTSNRTFCAGARNGMGPCNGDSGTGFIIAENNRWMLRGLVSLSLEDKQTRTCDLNQYVVFTDVAQFDTWLLETITLN